MELYQFWTIIGAIGAGFAWTMLRIDKSESRSEEKFKALEAKIDTRFNLVEEKLSSIEGRLSFIEGILAAVGMPVKQVK